MERPNSTLVQRVGQHQDLVRVLLMLVAVVAVMAVLTAIFGVTHSGPSYDIIPDPGAALGF